MNNGDRKKIWVSYARTDRKLLNLFEAEIIRYSHDKVIVLSDKSFPQYDYNDVIEEYIYSSDIQVLIITPAFLNSKYCKKEMGFMFTPAMNNKKIYPITLMDFNIRDLVSNGHVNLKSILDEWPLKRLADSALTENRIGEECSWNEFAKTILRDINIPIWAEPALIDYKKHIREGKFVPFIGPECYGLVEDWSPVLPKLEARLKKLENELTRDNNDWQFVRAVVESRVPVICNSLISLNEPQEKANDYSADDHFGFFDLSVAIAKAGAAASRIIGKSLSTGAGLHDARHFSIKSTKDDSDVQVFRGALTAATSVAAMCPVDEDCLNMSDSVRMCLGSSGIAIKLGILQKCIFPPGRTDENSIDTASDSFLILTLSQLDWLGDLLWHILRFDLPILPRSDELAFQLSVCQASDCLVRIPLGTTGVVSAGSDGNNSGTNRSSIVHGLEKCTHLIYRHLSKNRHTRPPSSINFYRAIAKLLWQRYAANKSSPDLSSKCGSALEAIDSVVKEDGTQLYHSMAVSVNLDTELEYCLDHVEYLVITPVQTVEGKIPAWMLRINRPTQRKDDFYMLSQNAELMDIQEFLNGPLILKLRGSTLHELPQDSYAPSNWIGTKDSTITNGHKIENRLLLSSLEYARELYDPKMGQPSFIQYLLKQEYRVMCFFGYPLDDPDALLGIQRGVWVAKKQENSHEKLIVSIGCDRHDGLGNAFLSGLSVEPLNIDLNKVANEIANIPNLEEIPAIKA